MNTQPNAFRTDNMHANAKLTPLTRAQMVLTHVGLRLSLRDSALAFGVCEKTVRRWLARAKAQGSPAGLGDRSLTPLRQPRKTGSEFETQILTLRRERRTYAKILMVLPISKATLSQKVSSMSGVSSRPIAKNPTEVKSTNAAAAARTSPNSRRAITKVSNTVPSA